MKKATEQVLGDKAQWGFVGYAGEAHMPANGTYPGIDAMSLRYTTQHDSGAYPMPGERSPLANLTPLIMAALNDVGFAWEAGPLSTWSN
ncbi:MAG TPA: hypothetical protein VGB83_05595 [Actinomycetota bacterium]